MKTLPEIVIAHERAILEVALAKTGGRIADTATLLGVSKVTLWRKMKACGARFDERSAIESALNREDGRIAQTALVLGISTVTLWRKMRKYGLLRRTHGDKARFNNAD